MRVCFGLTSFYERLILLLALTELSIIYLPRPHLHLSSQLYLWYLPMSIGLNIGIGNTWGNWLRSPTQNCWLKLELTKPSNPLPSTLTAEHCCLWSWYGFLTINTIPSGPYQVDCTACIGLEEVVRHCRDNRPGNYTIINNVYHMLCWPDHLHWASVSRQTEAPSQLVNANLSTSLVACILMLSTVLGIFHMHTTVRV